MEILHNLKWWYEVVLDSIYSKQQRDCLKHNMFWVTNLSIITLYTLFYHLPRRLFRIFQFYVWIVKIWTSNWNSKKYSRSSLHTLIISKQLLGKPVYILDCYTKNMCKIKWNAIHIRSRLCVCVINMVQASASLRGVEWVHGLFLFPLVLGKM